MNHMVDQISSRILCWMIFPTLMIVVMSCAVIAPRKNESPIIGHPLADLSFVSGEPCEAPCWYGLGLDVSTKNDVITTLGHLAFVEPESIREIESNLPGIGPATAVSFGCVYLPVHECGIIYISNNQELVKRIHYSVSFTLTFEDLIAMMGTPGYIRYDIWGPGAGCNISLRWPEKEIVVSHLYKESTDQCFALREGGGVFPNTQVTDIVYMVKSGFGTDVTFHYPWPGFEEE